MAYFPMMIDLEEQPVLVIGGGTEGAKKVEVLHSFGARVTLIATDDRRTNHHISELAGKAKIPVNIVDDQELCSFIFPAIYKEHDVVCAVSSGGKSPYVAQYVRDRLKEVLPDDIGEINDKMGEYREKAKGDFAHAVDRRRFLKERFEELIG